MPTRSRRTARSGRRTSSRAPGRHRRVRGHVRPGGRPAQRRHALRHQLQGHDRRERHAGRHDASRGLATSHAAARPRAHRLHPEVPVGHGREGAVADEAQVLRRVGLERRRPLRVLRQPARLGVGRRQGQRSTSRSHEKRQLRRRRPPDGRRTSSSRPARTSTPAATCRRRTRARRTTRATRPCAWPAPTSRPARTSRCSGRCTSTSTPTTSRTATVDGHRHDEHAWPQFVDRRSTARRRRARPAAGRPRSSSWGTPRSRATTRTTCDLAQAARRRTCASPARPTASATSPRASRSDSKGEEGANPVEDANGPARRHDRRRRRRADPRRRTSSGTPSGSTTSTPPTPAASSAAPAARPARRVAPRQADARR